MTDNIGLKFDGVDDCLNMPEDYTGRKIQILGFCFPTTLLTLLRVWVRLKRNKKPFGVYFVGQNKFFKEASDKVLVARHEKKSRESYFKRVCNQCGMIQPEANPVNSPCEKCGNDVVMVMTTDEFVQKMD